MNATVRSVDELPKITKAFEHGASVHTATSPCKVYSFEKFQFEDPLPLRTKAVSEIAQRWAKNADMQPRLQRARARLAGLSGADDGGIRAIRLRAGLSQTELARVIGTSQPHIARIEGGTAEPTLDTCRRLASALGVDLNAIGRAFEPKKGAT